MLLAEGLEHVFSRHHRIAQGIRCAAGAWGLQLCAVRPELYSDTVSAIRVPAGFDANRLVAHALDAAAVERLGQRFAGRDGLRCDIGQLHVRGQLFGWSLRTT